MKKAFLIIGCCFLFTGNSFSQGGTWAWMKGNNYSNSSGVYGDQGVAAPDNTPPCLYEPCEWKDKNGDFWLFGGYSYTGYTTDVWKYSVAGNTWTWIKGEGIGNIPGVYGTKGIPGMSNHPGSRGFGMASWVDTSGNFWLFGGFGLDSYGDYGQLNDLWRYNPSTNEWTWMKGSNQADQIGTFGTITVPNVNNIPSAREETNGAWTDKNNNLWLFGGLGNSNKYNDVWKYDVHTNLFAWMKGTPQGGGTAIYGTIGVPNANNTPGPRYIYCKWKDTSENFWIFGGSTGNSTTDQIWRYNPTTNEWTFIKGAMNAVTSPQYGTPCVWSASNTLGSRTENRACWCTPDGNLWSFGGGSLGSTPRDDLWFYQTAHSRWVFVRGATTPNAAAIFAAQGVGNSSNRPNCTLGSISWIDNDQNLWLFGGMGNTDFDNYYNALWRYTPETGCPRGFIYGTITGSATHVCENSCVDFFDSVSSNATAWQWLFPGAVPSSSADQNPTNICYPDSGLYNVTLIITTPFGNDTLTMSNYITVNATPLPTITQNGDVLTCSSASAYQWQLSNTDISGATEQSYTYTESGLYTVLVTDSNGCSNYASIEVNVQVIENCSFIIPDAFSPNNDGNNDQFHLLQTGIILQDLSVFNRWGEKVFETDDINRSWNGTFRGVQLSSDVYTYYAQGTCTQSGEKIFQKGNVTLVR
ncbi:MAG TPA: kelch repeat-containing protein [Chitinophagales bacterium]|nr:kelch repeat-containing protein [Chitinophagales bacterium]